MNTEIINYSDVNVSDIKFETPQKKPTYYYSMINYTKRNNLLCHVTNIKFIEYHATRKLKRPSSTWANELSNVQTLEKAWKVD